ncbi:hypothetical protein LCL89_09235 [Halobacillus yeomjeoni]|uniref:hypothetical protein n=1 Tax=Halobacillus yeomjeoni TaxID=311194 RepID=UPI001CD7E81E|nr:hypothetical protein [Halobacillus yeomjeoni]MCA0984226.1 hypothetical protein [Halobacillus yeomjeoni]
MKKLMVIMLLVGVVFGSATPVIADIDEDRVKALKDIEETNMEINEKIQKAVDKSNGMKAEYLQKVREIREENEIYQLRDALKETAKKIEKGTNKHEQMDRLIEKEQRLRSKLEEKMDELSYDFLNMEKIMDEVTSELLVADEEERKNLHDRVNTLYDSLNETSKMELEETLEYTEDLEKVIQDVYDETLKMSNETIKKAAEKGVYAEQSWRWVQFGDRMVWIDPVRVIGGFH